MKNIGVEKGLGMIQNYLSQNGYQVQEIDHTSKNMTNVINQFDAILVSGMDEDYMGMEDTSTKVPVINVEGMSPEDIKNMLDSRANITK